MAKAKRRREPEDPPECDCCNYVRPVGGLRGYERSFPMEPGTWKLCRLCESTLACNVVSMPSAYPPGMGTILKSVNWVGNHVLKAIQKKGQALGRGPG